MFDRLCPFREHQTFEAFRDGITSTLKYPRGCWGLNLIHDLIDNLRWLPLEELVQLSPLSCDPLQDGLLGSLHLFRVQA